jgi:hypothetical protein
MEVYGGCLDLDFDLGLFMFDYYLGLKALGLFLST